MKKFAIVSILCCCGVIPSWATESPCDLLVLRTSSIYHVDMSELLYIGEFQKLESAMEKNYEEFRKQGNGDHLFYLPPFLNAVYQPGHARLMQWKTEMPKAFFANYVNGQNALRDADNLRRGRPVNAIPAKDMEMIRAHEQKARDAFALAKVVKPDRAIVDAALINADATEKGPEATLQHLKRAIAADPKNISARLAAIGYLDPRWGGSFEAMEEVVKQAVAAKLPATHMAYLTMAMENTKGGYFEAMKDKGKAREHYKKAYGICDRSVEAKSGLSRTIGQ